MKRNFDKKDEKKLQRTPTKQSKPKSESNISPTDVWTNAIKIISKATETNKKEEKPKTFDFSEFEEKTNCHTYETKAALFNALENGFLYSLNQKFENDAQLPAEFPSFFPTKRMASFDGPEIYKKLDMDTLFFIFYKDVNSIRQMHAAKSLKSKSWRFHTKYMSWFQRMDEPRIMTEDYEQGTFLFFDYESTWTNRKKKDFTFEYKFLEDIDL